VQYTAGQYSTMKRTAVQFSSVQYSDGSTEHCGSRSRGIAALTCRNKFGMASSKITISTVGPSPESFTTLSVMPGTLAWSLRSADDKIRKKLVPSMRHTTVQLRDGLVKALKSRKAIRTRTITIATAIYNSKTAAKGRDGL
jgi:hypothetical protein